MWRLAVVSCAVLWLTACNDAGEGQPAKGAASAPVAAVSAASASAAAREAPVAQAVVPETGLLRGLPSQAEVRGRVVMGKTPVEKAEVLIAAYDLATSTTGEPLGMALTDADGMFSMKYVLPPTEKKVEFLKIEARGIKYMGDADGMEKGLSMLSSIVDGLPAGSAHMLMLSPVSDMVFHRFRAVVAQGTEPHVALRRAAIEAAGNGLGSGFGFKTSPMLTPVTGKEQSASYMSAWDEAIRFEKIYPDSYFQAMSKDFEDGIFNAMDGDGKRVHVIIHDGTPKKYRIPANYFTELIAAASQRYLICQNRKLEFYDYRRIQSNCVTSVDAGVKKAQEDGDEE